MLVEARQQGQGQDGEDGSEHATVPAPPPLRLAADMIAAHVTQRIASGAVAGLPIEAADKQGWAGSYCLANCYQGGSSGVSAHSDRLTLLGPCPLIASLSLGATRTFRLLRQQQLVVRSTGGSEGSGGGGGDGAGSSAAAALGAAVAGIERVDVELPHNSLCIM